MQRVWVGIDIGKHHHHAVVIDSDGARLLSRRIDNDETALRRLIDDVGALADRVEWAVDMITGGAALSLALPAQAGQRVFYITADRACTRNWHSRTQIQPSGLRAHSHRASSCRNGRSGCSARPDDLD